MSLLLQVKQSGDRAWSNLNRGFEDPKERERLVKLWQGWANNYPTFTDAQFRIVSERDARG